MRNAICGKSKLSYEMPYRFSEMKEESKEMKKILPKWQSQLNKH